MRGIKPNLAIWKRVNEAILDENAATVLVTLISGLCQLLIQSGVARDESHARVQMAAMLLSPDNAAAPGSLLPQIHAEISRLNDGKWIV